MDLELKGRTALVTGSSRGLGKAIAIALASEGVSVIINGRYAKEVGNTAYEIEHSFDFKIKAYQLACDASDPAKIKDLFEEKIAKIGQLDILVNNVGNLEKFGKFEDLTEQDWQNSFNLTFMSAVHFTNSCLPYLRKSNQARIINISSLSAHQPGYFNPHYSIAKAALNNLTKHLAGYLGKDGITVNAICPSTLYGGGWHQNVIDRARRQNISVDEAEELMIQEECRKSPLGKIGTLEDVTNKVLFLASSRANFLTGHIHNVDGGITRSV